MLRNFFISIGLVIGIQIGWFIAIGYVLHIMDRKQEVMTMVDYSRLHEIQIQLKKDRFLWF